MDRRADQAVARMAIGLGMQVREERMRRRWTLAHVGARAGLSTSAIHRVESGRPAALGSYVRIALALGLRPDFDLADDRRLAPPRAVDPVHAWMGEVEAARLLAADLSVALDEPYQYYQFAGRADLVAWSLERRSLLHIENRTRFPNLQDSLGSYNAKRAYLARALAERLNLRGGFSSVTHALVGLVVGRGAARRQAEDRDVPSDLPG
jgi:transcriptional regulator with XRE-family HTH domain